MKTRNCTTQAELDEALRLGMAPILTGGGSFLVDDSSQVTACESSQVRAYGSSQVTAHDSSQVTAHDSSQVTAHDSSQVRACGSSQVRAYGSSQVRAYGSSQVRAHDSSQVRACGSSQVRAYGSSQVRASRYVAVSKHGDQSKVSGGVLILIPKPETPQEWCDFHGVNVRYGVAILYKALDKNFKSSRDFDYSPGTVPVAPDWDGGRAECGGGLHFSPRPFMALAFMPDAGTFVACPVAMSDISVHPNGSFPEKIKAKGCCGPVWECDIDGNAAQKTT